jgi:uncharacterized protein
MNRRININDNHLGCFNTVNGVIFNLAEPDPDMVLAADIVTGLSNYCRFGGHMTKFYSVAQHCVLVALLAPASLRKAALLHDASEAYLGDVIKPLKNILGDTYMNLEAMVMNVITERYQVSESDLEAVKEYDKQAVVLEDQALRMFDKQARADWNEIWESSRLYSGCWSPKLAAHVFGWWLKDEGVR